MKPAGIVELFLRQVESRPDAVAVISDGVAISYRSLHERASVLAQAVNNGGLGRQSVVALYLPRGHELAVGVLGVLGAGHTFVALDPFNSADVNSSLLRHCGATTIVHDGALPAELTGYRLAVELRELAPAAPTGGLRPARAKDIAYIAYTSGSTGRPKGIAVVHDGVAEHFASMAARSGIPADGVSLQCAPLSSEASVRDLLFPLTIGHRVVIPTEAERVHPNRMVELIRRHAVNWLPSAVPTLLADLVEAIECDGSPLPNVTQIWAVGDFLPAALRMRLAATFPAAQLGNQYGPTEATMTSTFVTFGPDKYPHQSPTLVGRPNSGVSVEILDPGWNSLQPNQIGEVVIGGAGVTRGYHRDPARTAAAFIPDPHVTGGRRYCTGDIGRLRTDGQLELLGRLDRRVKVRGAIVDMAEPEMALGAHPSVTEAAVVAVGAGVTLALVAYVTCSTTEPGLTAADLTVWLARQMQATMVPSVIRIVSELPRTVTGKVDRSALAQLASMNPPPTEITPEAIATMWAEVFGCDIESARTADFFSLGGDSVTAARVVAQCRVRFGRNVSLPTLMDYPGLEAFARAVSLAPPAAEAASLPLGQVGR